MSRKAVARRLCRKVGVRGERRNCDSWRSMRTLSPASKQATTTAFSRAMFRSPLDMVWRPGVRCIAAVSGRIQKFEGRAGALCHLARRCFKASRESFHKDWRSNGPTFWNRWRAWRTPQLRLMAIHAHVVACLQAGDNHGVFACNVPLAARYGLAAWRAVHCGREW